MLFRLVREGIGISQRLSAIDTCAPTGVSDAHPPGRAMARTGLRMMPTFPSLPLKFRKSSFPRYGFKAGISGRAFPAERRLRLGRFASALRAHRLPRLCPALCRGTQRVCALPCETAALMLGSDKSRGYCLEMICADFLVGANLTDGDSDVLLRALSRSFHFLPANQQQAFLQSIGEQIQ